MKTLLTITDHDIDSNVTNVDPKDFSTREASRAIVLDKTGRVFLLKINRDHYHKLPGGGIEEGEDIKTALARELLEEIGCTAEVATEIGEIVEYRNQEQLKQISFCFIAKQFGEQLPPSFEQGEIDEGSEILLVESIDDAIRLLENDTPDDYTGKFIRIRDLHFLRSAKQIL